MIPNDLTFYKNLQNIDIIKQEIVDINISTKEHQQDFNIYRNRNENIDSFKKRINKDIEDIFFLGNSNTKCEGIIEIFNRYQTSTKIEKNKESLKIFVESIPYDMTMLCGHNIYNTITQSFPTNQRNFLQSDFNICKTMSLNEKNVMILSPKNNLKINIDIENSGFDNKNSTTMGFKGEISHSYWKQSNTIINPKLVSIIELT